METLVLDVGQKIIFNLMEMYANALMDISIKQIIAFHVKMDVKSVMTKQHAHNVGAKEDSSLLEMNVNVLKDFMLIIIHAKLA